MKARALSLLFLFILITSASAQTAGSAPPDCFEHLQNDARYVDSIAVLTSADSTVEGERVLVDFTFSRLSVEQSVAPDQWRAISIGFDRVSQITYRKSGHARRGMTFLGLGLGLLVGGVLGVAVAPEPDRSMELPEVKYGFIGAATGGLIGAVGFNLLGARISTRVTLDCR
jgi:hypothetical protein